MFVDASHYCKSCCDCAMKKAACSGHKEPLRPVPVEGSFHQVRVDCFAQLPVTTSRSHYIVMFTHHFTKWPKAFSVSSTEVTCIA